MQYTLEKSHKKTKSQLGSVRQNVLSSLTIRAFSRKLYFWPNQNQTTYSQRSKLSIEFDEGFEKRRNPPRSTLGGKQGLLSLRREQSNLALSLTRALKRGGILPVPQQGENEACCHSEGSSQTQKLSLEPQKGYPTGSCVRTKETKEIVANVKRKTARQLRAKKNKQHMQYTSEKSHKK